MSEPSNENRVPGGRMMPPLWFLLSLIAMGALHALLPVRQILSFPIRWAGAVLLVAGTAGIVTTAMRFTRADTPIRPFERSTTLLVTGPYRFSRNPIYVGFIVSLTGVAVLLGSLTPFLVVPAFALILHFRFVLREERMLEETFGAGYATYRRRVRRWL